MSGDSYVYDRTASVKESDRLRAIQTELRAIAKRLEELSEQAVFTPEVVKEFPKQYQAKANWFTFPKAPGHCEKAGSEALSAASAIEMAINIADSSGQ